MIVFHQRRSTASRDNTSRIAVPTSSEPSLKNIAVCEFLIQELTDRADVLQSRGNKTDYLRSCLVTDAPLEHELIGNL